jgi:hypothetical protein
MKMMKSNHSGDKLWEHLSFDKIQIAFVHDCTGSMSKYIEQTMQAIERLVTGFFENSEFYKYEFGFIGYRDHCDKKKTFLIKECDFLKENKIIEFIKNNISAKGGGDIPEAVLPGLRAAVTNLSWADNAYKIVFHLANSPPHGKQYFLGKDDYPNGCPLGNTIGSVSKLFKEKEIEYALIECTSPKCDILREMKYIFQKSENFGGFSKWKLDDSTNVLTVVRKRLKRVFELEKKNIYKTIEDEANKYTLEKFDII